MQAYTHPLWFLLISGLSVITGNVFIATFILSIAFSLAVLWLLISRVAVNFWVGALAVSVLLLSKAYVDFSTSGLENPLSHLLIITGILLGIKAIESKRINDQIASLFTFSVLYLSRPDLALLIAPFCLLVLCENYQSPKKLIQVLIIAALPIIIWTLFSLIYYGFPFPNTAYAKLGTGISLGQQITHGKYYLITSIVYDPLTIVAILFGIYIGLISSKIEKILALGVVSYLLYSVSIGGDFMAGRFFTAPLLLAVIIWHELISHHYTLTSWLR